MKKGCTGEPLVFNRHTRYSRADGNTTVFLTLQKNRLDIYVTSTCGYGVNMTEEISSIHFFNVFLVLASCTISGIWGLILFFMKKTINRPWRIAIIVTAVVSALQALLGVILILLGQKPGTGTGLYYLHYVYGAIVVLAIPVAITYATGGKNQRRDHPIFTISSLGLRA